ncbi:hypothetical protein ACLB2K_019106 [Fragaria x ananassa]
MGKSGKMSITNKHGSCTILEFQAPFMYFMKAYDLWVGHEVEKWFRLENHPPNKLVSPKSLKIAVIQWHNYTPLLMCDESRKELEEVALLCFSFLALYSRSYMAKEKSPEEKLVPQQEVIYR